MEEIKSCDTCQFDYPPGACPRPNDRAYHRGCFDHYQPKPLVEKQPAKEVMPLIVENPFTPASTSYFAVEETKEAQREADREWHDKEADKLNKRIQHLKDDCQLLFSKVEYLEAENDKYKSRLLEEAETLTAIMNISPKEIFKHIAELREGNMPDKEVFKGEISSPCPQCEYFGKCDDDPQKRDYCPAQTTRKRNE